MKGSLADLTNDLQRLQAEYANYRKRVDRDRQLVAESASYKALTPVIEVLDTIDRAKEHGELEGGFKAVADQLERVGRQLPASPASASPATRSTRRSTRR